MILILFHRWHLVVNLEPAAAITQNFVPKSHLRSAVRFLRDKADQVSGFKDDVTDAYRLFIDRLREAYPDLAESLESDSKKRKWEDIVGQEDVEREHVGFSFAFGVDDIEDEEDVE